MRFARTSREGDMSKARVSRKGGVKMGGGGLLQAEVFQADYAAAIGLHCGQRVGQRGGPFRCRTY